jgi:hypothetical protein
MKVNIQVNMLFPCTHRTLLIDVAVQFSLQLCMEQKDLLCIVKHENIHLTIISLLK